MTTATEIVRTATTTDATLENYVLVRAAMEMGAVEIERKVANNRVESVVYWPHYVSGDLAGRELRASYVAPPPHGLSTAKMVARAVFIAAEKASLGID